MIRAPRSSPFRDLFQSAQTLADTAQQTTPQTNPWELSPLAMGLLGLMAAALAGIAVHFLILVPRRRRKPLLLAEGIIEGGETHRFEEAEELLGTALTGGMRKGDIRTARFLLSYVRARLGRFHEASTVLAELEGSAVKDLEATYLNLWVQSRLEDHEKVERIFTNSRSDLLGFLDANLIVGISFLERARQHWARKEVQGAMHYFHQLRELEVLLEEIPSQVEDHESLLGIVALFDGSNEEGRLRFQGAIDSAAQEGRSTVQGRLGLLLCDWREADTPDIDAQLAEIATELGTPESSDSSEPTLTHCEHCHQAYRIPACDAGERLTCRRCGSRFIAAAADVDIDDGEASDENVSEDRLLTDRDLLLRNVFLWYAISLLFSWRRLPAQKGLPPTARDELCKRTAEVSGVDPEMGAPYLAEGLISYYFAQDDEARKAAVELLDRAVENEVTLPEVLNLVDREHHIAEFMKDALRRYFRLLEGYIGDPTVPDEACRELRDRLARFARFRQFEEEELVEFAREGAPSLLDLESRGLLMGKRVRSLIDPGMRSEEETKEISDLLKAFAIEAEAVQEGARRMQKAEVGLLARTGEFLLKEEAPAPSMPETEAEAAQSVPETEAEAPGEQS